MNVSKALLRFFACFALVTLLCTSTSGQGTDTRWSAGTGYNKRAYIGFNFTPKSGSIRYTDIAELDLKIEKRNSIDFSVEGGFFFSELLGISLGAGLSSYSSTLTLANYSTSYNAVDSEHENYTMQITGSGITEDQKLSFITLPICLIFRYLAGEKLSFFIKGGLVFNIPGEKSYESSGTFSYKGYYPAYPVTLENIPVGGFYNDLLTSVKGDLEVKSMVTSITASTGLSLYISKAVQLTFSGCFNSAGNISGYKGVDNFSLSGRANEIKSFMAGSKSSGIQSFGLNAGIIYYLR